MRLPGGDAPLRLDIRPDWRQTLTAIAGTISVLLVAVGLFYTNDANRRQQEANRAQQALAERGQITDRFSRAIDQLGQEGPERLSIRLGALYALERLMRDSPGDEPAIIEVICAFVRTHAAVTREQRVAGNPPVNTSVDVQAAVIVLSRRPDPYAPANAGLNLADAVVGLPHGRLAEAHLAGADLTYADLQQADLTGADLSRAMLYEASLMFADLSRANLSEATLADAALRKAKLSGANLSKAMLHGTSLNGANLSHANLSGADFFATDVSGADLTGADLAGANLAGIDLHYVAGITTEQLRCSRISPETKLPPGVTGRSSEQIQADPACRR
ncbi:pentapeptide repeat-containing protein [Dactylosporangium vinaceum]|uniref:Pentapeptide repeat-containing protein n=1 Tax=Dactylosporangium vinaceum TaxID=53362 RepID=A0ABV5M9E9_9ACTN|nr:pentapeptide repeat-containing protein [Dactylosporangium vinaceum]UAB99984.1 pentapeptide repeat-containing protein [Dactylosporangium vinaceum]